MNDVLVNILSYVVAPIVTIYVTNFFVRKKVQAEVKTNELQNVEGAIKIWRELAESFEQKLNEKEEAFAELKKQLEFITSQNREMISKLTLLEKDYDKLKRNYITLKKSLEQ
jgi:chromosome condensin MukBEF ATPase and DNA-binding subunit MukB